MYIDRNSNMIVAAISDDANWFGSDENYFQIRDLAKATGFEVERNGKTLTLEIKIN